MPKRSSKKKVKESVADLDMEIILSTRTEMKFVDTKAITRVGPEFKWG